MKQSIKGFIFASLALVALGLVGLQAMPKYTDKQTVMALAEVLDKGKYKRFTIASTYVQNRSSKDYYLSVVLSNGESRKWNMQQIYKMTRDDEIALSNNRTLLFLNPRLTQFVVFDKNAFHRKALTANVYIKKYNNNDPLEGLKFRFHIKSFNLIAPNERAFGRDPNGSKYRYKIDLYNGTKELLTFEDAYRVLKNNRLKVEKETKMTTFGRAYQVTKLLAYPKGKVEDGIAQFGVEIQFDQNIQLTGDQFPVEIYERKIYNSKTRRTEKKFVMDITIPNAELKYPVRRIKSLEYLHNIRIAKNPNKAKRLYLRSNVNPQFVDIPPVVYKNSDNSVYVNFFALIDQSVVTRGTLLQDRKLRQLKSRAKRQIRVKKNIKRDTDYGRAFVEALETRRQAKKTKKIQPKIGKLLEAIREFEEAALYAETDQELYNALNKRNELRDSIILLTVNMVRNALRKADLGGMSPRVMMDQLDLAESFTGKTKMIKTIVKLREKLISAQK